MAGDRHVAAVPVAWVELLSVERRHVGALVDVADLVGQRVDVGLVEAADELGDDRQVGRAHDGLGVGVG